MKARAIVIAVAIVAAAVVSAIASAHEFSAWSPATRVEITPPGADPAFNGPDLDGCPFIARDNKTFFMASNRPNGIGGIDIWVSTRRRTSDPWGAPVNVGRPVNSEANDFCPTLAPNGHRFYFVSNRPDGCGGADIYTARLRGDGSFDRLENLGCVVNSAADEASPFPLREQGSGRALYFSSSRPGGFSAEAPGAMVGDSDLYRSERREGVYGAAELVPGVNTAAEDGQPNLRHDGRELFFFSTRPGTHGMADLYAATRTDVCEPWSTPTNLGPHVNSAAAETRPSLSWDGTTLYFGSTRPGGDGSADHYVTTRERLSGRG
jgi:hypothetical protein